MTSKIAILRGDGIGPEIIAQAVRVLDKLIEQGLDAQYQYAPLGGEAYDQYGAPYPEFTQNLCRAADAVLLGAPSAGCWRFVKTSTSSPTCVPPCCTKNSPTPPRSNPKSSQG